MEQPKSSISQVSNDRQDTSAADLLILPHHLAQLTDQSGISLEIINARGYRSIHGPESYSVLKNIGFNRTQCRFAPGLLVPVLDITGTPVLHQFRPDTPRLDKASRAIKYETPAKATMRLDLGVQQHEMLKDPKLPLWITEGIKKGDALRSCGQCAVTLLGVYNFKGKNAYGGVTFLADWDYIALNGRQVRIVFDNDVMTKPQVRQALDRLTEHLQRRGAHVVAVYLPTEGRKKIGVDDYLRNHTIKDLEGLVEAPRPQPQPAKPLVKLLPEPPKILSRLLAWIDGQAYAATWLWTETTISEIQNAKGEIVHLSEPQKHEAPALFVMRDDGVLFGDPFDPKVKPLAELGMSVKLVDKPPDRLLWTPHGVTAYLRGVRPGFQDVFARVVQVYDHFLDFSRSLDEQIRMCRLSACMSWMTWFADAFTVLPYPWPNSPAPGSGKTKWGHCWTGTSYLGYLTSAAGSFASLRDLADMGATLLFDDAEVLADTQKADPDKQMLILTGNRKGVNIPVKEQGTDGRWHTRWLNAYCPRGFTSLRLPFRALQSRSIVIPLVASADPARANRDPENEQDWPVDRQQLLADLWALGLCLQREASDMWNNMSKETSVVGRDWERWRAILTVAHLFERHGVKDLTSDMLHIMSAYQDQKDELEGTSRIALVIRALMRIVNLPESDKWTCSDVSDMLFERVQVSATQISQMVKTILTEEQEGEDETPKEQGLREVEKPQSWTNPHSIGIILSKLRLPKDRATPSVRTRYRLISQHEVFQLAIAHHLIHLKINMSETSEHVHLSERCPTCGGHDWEEIPSGDAICKACSRRAS
jgi:hypothetical protein